MNIDGPKTYLLFGVLYAVIITLANSWHPITVAVPFVVATIWAGDRIGGQRGCLFIGIMCIEIAFILWVWYFTQYNLPWIRSSDLSGVTG